MRAEASGLARGFGVFDEDFAGARRDAQATLLRAVEWLRGVGPDARVFLFAHLYDAHGPYLPPPDYAGTFRARGPGRVLDAIPSYQLVRDPAGRPLRDLDGYVDRYDTAIRFADDQLGELLAVVDPEHTLVVIVSDHGETLGERAHVLDHGGQVFDEQIRIPLVMRGPGLAPRRVESPVETVDLLPTLLELLDVPAPPQLAVEGRSLVPLLRGAAEAGRPVFSSSRAIAARHRDRGYRFRPGAQIHSVRGRDWKLVVYPTLGSDTLELYDLGADPGERDPRDGAGSDAARLALLEAWLARAARAADAAAPPPPDPALREQLRQLGYAE
jgi:arylsulfatase A-like enzyme